MKEKKNLYDDYFDKFKDKATCKTCGSVLSCAGRTTSGLKYHIEKVHGITLAAEAEPAEKKMKTIHSFFKAKKPPLEELVSKSATKKFHLNFLLQMI